MRAALGLTLGGPIAVLLAIWLLTSLPASLVRGLVFVVIVYNSISLLWSAVRESRVVTITRDTSRIGTDRNRHG